MNFEQLVAKVSSKCGFDEANASNVALQFLSILNESVEAQEDIVTPNFILKTSRTSPKPSPSGKQRAPKNVGKISFKN